MKVIITDVQADSATCLHMGSDGKLEPSGNLSVNKCYVPSKIVFYLSLNQIFFTPPKENSKTRVHFAYIWYMFLRSHVVKAHSSISPSTAYFCSYPTILSPVPTPVINSHRSLTSFDAVAYG